MHNLMEGSTPESGRRTNLTAMTPTRGLTGGSTLVNGEFADGSVYYDGQFQDGKHHSHGTRMTAGGVYTREGKRLICSIFVLVLHPEPPC